MGISTARPAPLLLTLILSAAGGPPALAVDEAQLREKWRTPYGLYLSAQEASALKKQRGAALAFVDVRTRAELKYVGAPQQIDVNVPLRFFQTERWSERNASFATDPNHRFSADLLAWLATRGGGRDTPIVLMCQSGSRSPIAARLLHRAGFREVYTLYEGFEGVKAKSGARAGQRVVNGWKNAGLPWSYRLSREKLYAPDQWAAAAGASSSGTASE